MKQLTKPRVVLLSNGADWEALYVNGFKMTESHRIPLSEIFLLLGIDFENREADTTNDENGEFPNKLQ